MESKNGLKYDNERISSRILENSDIIRIDDEGKRTDTGVLLLFSDGDVDVEWLSCDLNENIINIGVESSCNIIKKSRFYYLIPDEKGTVTINGKMTTKKTRLHEKDVISIDDNLFIFGTGNVYYREYVVELEMNRSYDFTANAEDLFYNLIDLTVFKAKDDETIYNFIKEKIPVIPFGDYLKRW